MRSRGPSPTTWWAMLRSPLFAYRVSGGADGIEPPLAGDAFQLVDPALLELDPGARHEILDRRGDEHLARRGCRSETRPDRDGDPGDLSVVELAFPGVHAGTNLEAELAHAADDRLRRPDRARGTVERGEEPVARGVPLLAPEARKLASHERMVPREEIAPGAVADLRGALGGADQIREEDRREHAVRHLRLEARRDAHRECDLRRTERGRADAPS